MRVKGVVAGKLKREVGTNWLVKRTQNGDIIEQTMIRVLSMFASPCLTVPPLCRVISRGSKKNLEKESGVV